MNYLKGGKIDSAELFLGMNQLISEGNSINKSSRIIAREVNGILGMDLYSPRSLQQRFVRQRDKTKGLHTLTRVQANREFKRVTEKLKLKSEEFRLHKKLYSEFKAKSNQETTRLNQLISNQTQEIGQLKTDNQALQDENQQLLDILTVASDFINSIEKMRLSFQEELNNIPQ